MESSKTPLKKKDSKKTRVPDDKRKRALVSCDICKKRRVKCLKVGNDPCQHCKDKNEKCEVTLPRKTRIYGSVETLSMRYRVLDTLIKGLFPDNDTSSIDVLYELAEKHGITLPDFSGDNFVVGDTRIEDVFTQVPKEWSASPASPANSAASPQISKDVRTPEKSATVPNSPKETLVPTPSGGEQHYIGASSSFAFTLSIRALVKDYVGTVRQLQPSHPNLKLMTIFGNSRWSKALEPKVAEIKHTAPGPADLERDTRGSQNHHVPPIIAGEDPSETQPLVSLLPPRDIANVLIRSFFDRVHPNILLFRRIAFEQRFDQMWTQLNIQVKEFETGWLCSVLMAFILGAQALGPSDEAYLQLIQNYKRWVQSRISQLQISATMVNVQALVLLHLDLHNMSERNAASQMLGAASRMAMALGMHREGSNQSLDTGESQLRRRVWFTIYVLEHNSSIILGRPCPIDDTEVSVKYPDEELLDGCACVPKGYVEALHRLTKIMATSIKTMYPPRWYPDTQSARIEATTRNAPKCLTDLETWHYDLPEHLRLNAKIILPIHRRAVILLHLQFYFTQSLVTRPFMIRKAGVRIARRLGKDLSGGDLNHKELVLSSKCSDYAKQAILLVHQLITLNQFDGVTWSDPYYVYHSVLIIALDFLAKDEPDDDADIMSKKVIFDIKNAMININLCPVFAMLTQVAWQLAQIVGIIDNHETNAQPQQIDSSYLHSFQTIPDYPFDLENSQPGSNNLIDLLLQGSHVTVPWRIGAASIAPAATQVSAPMMDPFMSRSVALMDEPALTATIQGGQMQPQQSYTNWTPAYGMMSPQTQFGNQTGPSHTNGNSNGNGNGNAQMQYGNSTAGPSHINGDGNSNGHSLAHYANQTSASHVHGNGTGNGNSHPHTQYANPQAGLAPHRNGGFNDYENRRN